MKRLGWLQQTLFGDHRKKTITGLVALTLLTLAAFLVPYELKMKVDGVLHPELRRHVYSESKGIIDKVHFEDGQEVTKGELLLEMVDYDRKQLMKERQIKLQRLEDQKRAIYSQINDVPEERRQSISAELESIAAQIDETEKMIANDSSMESEVLQRRSPINGNIVTWNPQQRLKGLVVEANQTLVTVSQLKGEWQLEVKIPHIKVGYVDTALDEARTNGDGTIDAQFALSTNPSKTYYGKLQQVSIRPHTDSAGIQMYRGIIKVDADDLDLNELKPGAGATVKIHCGKVPLYKAWLHQPIDWCRTNLWWY